MGYNLLKVSIIVDVLSLMLVLQLVSLDVLPQSVDDDWTGLGVDSQQAGQAGVQLVLWWLNEEKWEEKNNNFLIMSKGL